MRLAGPCVARAEAAPSTPPHAGTAAEITALGAIRDALAGKPLAIATARRQLTSIHGIPLEWMLAGSCQNGRAGRRMSSDRRFRRSLYLLQPQRRRLEIAILAP